MAGYIVAKLNFIIGCAGACMRLSEHGVGYGLSARRGNHLSFHVGLVLHHGLQ